MKVDSQNKMLENWKWNSSKLLSKLLSVGDNSIDNHGQEAYILKANRLQLFRKIHCLFKHHNDFISLTTHQFCVRALMNYTTAVFLQTRVQNKSSYKQPVTMIFCQQRNYEDIWTEISEDIWFSYMTMYKSKKSNVNLSKLEKV